MYPGTAEPPRANSLSPSVEKVGSRSPGLAVATPGTASTAAAAAAAIARSCPPRLPIFTNNTHEVRLDRDRGRTGTFSPPLPTIPRFPIIGDPLLRRIRVPADLDAVTTVGRRGRPARPSGMARDVVEAHLGLGARPLPQRASTPRSRSACAARARSCSTARSATPAATARTTARTSPKVPSRPTRRSSSTRPPRRSRRCVVHMLDERGAAVTRRPGRPVHPRVRPPRQGRDHDRARARAPRRRPEPARSEALDLDLHRRPRAPRSSVICDAKPRDARRASCSPTTRSRAASSSARSSAG